MSVRRRTWRDAKGRVHEAYVVDVEFEHADGRRERIRKVSPVQTRRGAEEYERQVRQQLLAGTYGKKKEVTIPTVAEFGRGDFDIYAQNNNKASERSSKRSALKNHIIPAVGQLRLDHVTTRVIEHFKAQKLREGLSKKYINNLLTVLHKLLVTAADFEFIRHEQVPRFKWFRVPKAKFDFLTFEEADRLLSAAPEPDRTMLLVALRTGLRMGELRALEWGDVDLVTGRLIVTRNVTKNHAVGTPKNGKDREIPLADSVVRALKAHRHLKGKLVFCDEAGNLLTEGEVRWPLERACKRAGLRQIGMHVLRHTFASHLVMKGVALKAVQELLGHSTVQMTLRYSHLAPEVCKDAVNLLDQPASGTLTAHRGRE